MRTAAPDGGSGDMAVENPFADDAARGDLWEQGFLAGFAAPSVEHERSVEPDLLEAYLEGQVAGARARLALPPDVGGVGDVDTEIPAANAAFEFGVHTLGNHVFDRVFPAAGSMTGLVGAVVHPSVEPTLVAADWEGPMDGPDEKYVAVCPRDDHDGTGDEHGYWAAPGRDFFYEVIGDLAAHDHDEAFVARCSLADGGTGAIWVGPAGG
ncbi:hypothetical protein DW322_20725 [Rhodococcus rhodnii]|nr:hypothetical protein DW322_20725 [Rhodococcus rhodnii]